jgi:hypothetical protein
MLLLLSPSPSRNASSLEQLKASSYRCPADGCTLARCGCRAASKSMLRRAPAPTLGGSSRTSSAPTSLSVGGQPRDRTAPPGITHGSPPSRWSDAGTLGVYVSGASARAALTATRRCDTLALEAAAYRACAGRRGRGSSPGRHAGAGSRRASCRASCRACAVSGTRHAGSGVSPISASLTASLSTRRATSRCSTDA